MHLGMLTIWRFISFYIRWVYLENKISSTKNKIVKKKHQNTLNPTKHKLSMLATITPKLQADFFGENTKLKHLHKGGGLLHGKVQV